MNVVFDPSQLVFHGTIDLYANIIEKRGMKLINRKKRGVDFGPGFYLSVGIEQQALEMALQRKEVPRYYSEALEPEGITYNDFRGLRDSVRPAIMMYRIRDIGTWQQLRHKVFLEDDLDWKRYVWKCRHDGNIPIESYDWVFGPVADGGYDSVAPELIKDAKDGYNQISIHNQETYELLELLEVRTW